MLASRVRWKAQVEADCALTTDGRFSGEHGFASATSPEAVDAPDAPVAMATRSPIDAHVTLDLLVTIANWPSAGRRAPRPATPVVSSKYASWCKGRDRRSPTRCGAVSIRDNMNLQEALELIQLRRFERDPVQRLINRTHMPDDFAVAKRRFEAVFDYVEGGADERSPSLQTGRRSSGASSTRSYCEMYGHRPDR